MNAPIMVDNEATAISLMASKPIRETLEVARSCDVALLGVGTTNLEYSTFLHSGYFSMDHIQTLRAHGAVGNVCGLHFTIAGEHAIPDFQNRVLTIRKEELVSIPIRIGVAGGSGKVEALLGALRGGYLNILITDSLAAGELLQLVGG